MVVRIVFTLIVLLQFSSSTFAQSKDWKQIGSPLKTYIQIQHQTSHGFLFGKMIVTGQFYFSKDKGVTWANLSKGDLYYQGNFKIREDANANIYLSNSYRIYKFDISTFELTTIFEAPVILDFDFMNNGNLIVASRFGIGIFADSGQELYRHDTLLLDARLLLDPVGEKHYLHFRIAEGDFLREFNDNLSYLSESRIATSISYIKRNGNRLLSHKSYSDDGLHWNSLGFPQNVDISFHNIGHDGSLLYRVSQKLYISQDNGYSFSKTDLPLFIPHFISSDANSEIIISGNGLGNSLLFSSKDYGTTWNQITSDVGVPYMPVFSAGVNENLFLLSAYDKFYVKKDSHSDWSGEKPEEISSLSHPMSLSNGSNLALSPFNKVYITWDKGKSWTPRSHQFVRKPQYLMTEKSDAIMSWHNDTLYYSKNFGKTWQTITVDDPEVSVQLSRPIYLGYNMSAYAIGHGASYGPNLFYYNFETKQSITNPCPSNLLAFTTSFNDNTVYGVLYSETDRYLGISSDHGANFNTKKILGVNFDNSATTLKTDHLDNIYIYSHRQLLISRDQGDSWEDITPDFPELFNIYYLTISHDNYIYLAVDGMGVLKYNHQLAESKFDPNNHIFESLTVYPNPTNGLLSVYESVLKDYSQEVLIYDVQGKLILKELVKIHENTVDLRHCPPGVYFLVMYIGDKVYRMKVVKN